MSWGAAVGIMLMVVVLPCMVNEGGELAPWLAERLLRQGAKLLGSREGTERYAEEWLADLEHVPGKITKLGWACGLLLLSVPRLRWQARSRTRMMKIRSRIRGMLRRSGRTHRPDRRHKVLLPMLASAAMTPPFKKRPLILNSGDRTLAS